MRNRAKCKLCDQIIESLHRHDYVLCKCGEIGVDGGNDYNKVFAKNWENFLRIDDNGNVVVPKIVEAEKDLGAAKTDPKKENKSNAEPKPISKEDLLAELEQMAKNIEGLPQHAMLSPVNHYDLASALILLSAIFRSSSEGN